MKLSACINVACFLLLMSSSLSLMAQDTIPDFTSVSSFVKATEKRASEMEERVLAFSEKSLRKLEKHELKLKKILAKKDSLAAAKVFGDIKNEYTKLRGKLNEKAGSVSRLKEYLPGIDTLKTALSFLSSDEGVFSSTNPDIKRVRQAFDAVQGLDDKLANADALRQYLKERKQILKEQFDRFDLGSKLKKYNKEAYYYSQQIKEYKEVLKDPRKREQKALELITKTSFFQKFFQEHSELAQLFPIPANNGTAMALQGLQTRASVQSLIQQQLQGGGPNAQQYLQQGIQQAQAAMDNIKNKINKAGGIGSDEEIPDFTPNKQKSKSFWKRLELGTNLQNTRSNSFLPTTSDVGFSIGYKINDKSVIGIGASGKIGWGKDIHHVEMTGEGASLRSFIDWKLKGSFYVSGGYEQNYRTRFYNVNFLRNPSNWSQSGLIGLSKKYSISKKWKGDFKFYYDFLYRSHSPYSQPILFRVGYGL